MSTLSHIICASEESDQLHHINCKKIDAELTKIFWSAPMEAFFGQETVASVINCSTKTLECNRWRGKGIPFRKVNGRVLYQKRDVINWLEGYALVNSTSEYVKEEKND